MTGTRLDPTAEALQTSPRFGAACMVGRLVEVWIDTLVGAEQLESFGRRIRQACAEANGAVLLAADCRGVASVSEQVVPLWVELFRRTGPKVERSAILIANDQGPAMDRLHAVLRAATHAGRRVCTKKFEVVEWLEPCMTAEEKVGLRCFLASR